MSYAIDTTKELFLVTKQDTDKTTHIIMSKKEIQQLLKTDNNTTVMIREIQISVTNEVSKKYFLPKYWQRLNKKSSVYNIWKQIAEGDE